MSTFSIVPVELALDSRLSKTQIRVLIALLSFRSKNTDAVWPSRRALAERCGLPETRISTTTTELESLGWLVKEGRGGSSKSTRYKVTVPNLETVTEPGTVTKDGTVTESVTVTKPVTKTVTKPVIPTVTESVIPTVTKPVTRIEETIEQTKEETREETNTRACARGFFSEVNHVFAYWCEVMRKPAMTKLTEKRRRSIQARLREGYSVEQIKQAINGCARSPHHMGQNDTGTVYDDLTLICRSGDKLEQFANNIGRAPPKRGKEPETLDQFRERNRRQAERVMNSGLLDDLS